MKDLNNIRGVYFIGIGGIGMSALARYFRAKGIAVAGYDRSESSITKALTAEGCRISFSDDPDTIPELFRSRDLIPGLMSVFTPAIPADNSIIKWFRENGYNLLKRSEILGMISAENDTLAVSGTHGKTTVSTLLTHMLRESGIDCSSFLGGISKNYNTNMLTGKSRYAVMEADEFDRSFHRLSPLMAIVTSVDADHLDIYGDHETMIAAYDEFFLRIREGGSLVFSSRISDRITVPGKLKGYSYSLEGEADFAASGIRREGAEYLFDLNVPGRKIENLRFRFPGLINVENAVAAAAVAILCGCDDHGIRRALGSFSGVQRRFDIRIDRPGLTYIDDYAHHPEEIRACITSVREYFGGRRITGIFQPHLYSRTLDHAEGFARILDQLDEVILLPVYPAREKPVAGVESDIIYDRMKLENRKMMEKKDIPDKLDIKNIDVLITIGAGDIDRLVEPIEKALMSRM